jgi:hypothetical protein
MYAILAAPSANDRSPRYMEKALAAIHQALRPGELLRFEYAVHDGRIALGIHFGSINSAAVIGPILANYPQAACTPLAAAEQPRTTSAAECMRAMDLRLVPQIFPILRHAQFEDLLNRQYADPIDTLLAALIPSEGIECRVELRVSRADARRAGHARKAVSLLERRP